MYYESILWCKEGNQDKVWGVIRLDGHYSAQLQGINKTYKYVTFWGRRGGKLQTKIWEGTPVDRAHVANRKFEKGYRQVDSSLLHEVYPEFQRDLEKTAIWAILRS